MNLLTKIPTRYRWLAYIVYGVGSVVVTYLAAKGHVGADEIALWTGIGAVFGVTAAANTNTNGVSVTTSYYGAPFEGYDAIQAEVDADLSAEQYRGEHSAPYKGD